MFRPERVDEHSERTEEWVATLTREDILDASEILLWLVRRVGVVCPEDVGELSGRTEEWVATSTGEDILGALEILLWLVGVVRLERVDELPERIEERVESVGEGSAENG